MNSFKLQLIKQQPLIPTSTTNKPAPKVNINIQSIICLNYPIQTLIQVITVHFDEDPCPANIILKALKVISISLKDKQLRVSIEKILMQNLHKGLKIFQLFQYWSSLLPNLSPILSKFQTKTVDNILGCVISQYFFTDSPQKSQISKMINFAFHSFSKQNLNKIGQIVKNQFFSMGSPIHLFIKSISKINLKDQINVQFFSDIAGSIIKTKQSQNSLQKILQNYFCDSQVRTQIDQFFLTFPNILNYFSLNLQQNLSQQDIIDIWQRKSQFKMQSLIKSAIKEWINANDNFYSVFSTHYNKIRENYKLTKIQSLFQLAQELDQNSLGNSILVKQSIHNFLGQSVLDFGMDLKIIEQLSLNTQKFKKIHSTVQTMNDIAKSYSNILKNGQINILTLNKIHAPTHWNKTDTKMLKSVSIPLIKPFIDKLCAQFAKQQQKYLQKGKKIELAYHSIKIQINNEDNKKKSLIVTLHQLATILKQKHLPQTISFIQQYKGVEQTKNKQIHRQIQGFVIEARIVKVMKKSKQNLTFNQLFSELNQLNISQQNFRVALTKVISKGIVSQQSEGVYKYCP